MERLGANDVRDVLRFVGEAYAAAPRGDFRLEAIAGLRALVPADMTAWVETRAGSSVVDVVASPRDPLADGPRRFARIRDEHPVLAHFERSRHGGAARLSDFVGRAEYHRLPIYQEFFRPAGVEHQISIALPTTTSRLIRITLNRARRDFSERDRLVLNLVREHLAEAHAGAEEIRRVGAERDDLEQVAEALDVGVLVVRDGQHVAYASPRAERQLAAYFAARVRADRLPDALADWLGARRGQRSDGLPPPRGLLVVEGDGGLLEVRAVVSGERDVLLLRERATGVPSRPLESLGLTRRQAEVLAWVAQGRTNLEIAALLAISPSTVARHVEAIFERLDVQSRTAAAAAAFAHLAAL